MYFVIEDFLSFLFAPVISRAWRTRSARRIYFRKTSRWVRAPSIESAPTETPRTHEKARRKRHGLRIIALLYLRSRSYRRTRTRPVGRKCGGRHEREFRRARCLVDIMRATSVFENVYHTCVWYIPPRVYDGIEFMYGKGGLSFWPRVGHLIPRGHLSSKILLFRHPASLRPTDATGQSSSKGWIPAINYCSKALRTCRRRFVCDDGSVCIFVYMRF